MSIAEIRQRQAAEDTAASQKIAELIDRGESAEAEGKLAVARIYYEQAARRADGELQARLRVRIAELKGAASGR